VNIYIANTRTARLLARFRELDWGQMYCRGRLGGRLDQREPSTRYAYDNGAFVDWQRGQPFNLVKWLRDLTRIRGFRLQPDFAILPDRVAAGRDSLAFSMEWFDEYATEFTWYLAVQDGMERADIPWRSGIAGIFVGGSVPWKHETAHRWCDWAHEAGLRCHIGRAGTPAKVLWARRCGADSIDSSFPLWTKDRMAVFEQTVQQPGLFTAERRGVHHRDYVNALLAAG
jgi:hypothetical protein